MNLTAPVLGYIWVLSKVSQAIGVAQLLVSQLGWIGYVVVMIGFGGLIMFRVTGLMLPLSLIAAMILGWDWWWYLVIIIGEFEGPRAFTGTK